MQKVFAIVLILFICSLLPTQSQREEFSTGEELSVLLNEIITEYQASIQDFIFEHKFLTEESQEERLSILEQKTDELIGLVDNVNTQRVHLIQELQDEKITGKEFKIEMQRLTAEVAAVARSMNLLGKKISEISAGLPEELQKRALFLVEKFNKMAALMSEISVSISGEMGGQGYEPPEIPEIPEPLEVPEDTENPEEQGKPEDTEKQKGPGKPEDPGPPKEPGKPEDPGPPKGPGKPKTSNPSHLHETPFAICLHLL